MAPSVTTPETATTTVAPGAATLYFSATTKDLDKKEWEVSLDFRTVPAVVAVLPLFSKVVLTKVTAFVQQIDLPAAADAYKTHHLRFGIGYRTLNLTDGKFVTAVPHFEDCATSREGLQCTRTWGVGGLPFPPGVQLDVKAKEDIAEYAKFFLAQPVAVLGSVQLARAHVNFTLECSVGGFGA